MKNFLRVIIFSLSLILTLFYSIAPASLSSKMGNGNIYWVIIVILGICFGFVYGVGYTPTSKLWRLIINPIVILALIIIPILVLKFK